MKNKMPKFLEKKKRNPASRHPAKNTKGYSEGKSKGREQVRREEFRPESEHIKNNRADDWLDAMKKPRERNKMSSENIYGDVSEE
jgi:phage terminase small subunit